MQITSATLPSIQTLDAFIATYEEYVIYVLGQARLFPKLHRQKLVEAHGAWINDLNRVGDHEPKLKDGLDHLKQCGHLAFWLRRMSPLIDAADQTKDIGDSEGYPLSADERTFRDLLFGYRNEYLAFDFGFQICRFYQLGLPGAKARAESISLDEEFYRTMCHFLKYKTVSPHAMFLIYKSLFA